jgi:acetyl esterase/lipase
LRSFSRRQALRFFGGTALLAACGGGEPAPPAATAPPVAPTPPPSPTATPTARTFARVDRDIPYVEAGHPSQRLDLYFSAVSLRPAPLAVYIHGGAFFAGDKFEIAAPGTPFAIMLGELLSRGYTVASMNYRLSGTAPFPAAVEDCKAAVRFLRANAAKYGFSGRIGAFGGSAGGTLAAMLGLTAPADGLEGSANPNVPSHVEAVVDLFGPSDFTLPLLRTGPGGDDFLAPYLGPAPDAASRASPVTYVSRDDAPFLLIHGDRDDIVPLVHSQRLNEKLLAAGVKCQLVVVKNAGHIFLPAGGTVSPAFEEIARIIADFFDQEIRGA